MTWQTKWAMPGSMHQTELLENQFVVFRQVWLSLVHNGHYSTGQCQRLSYQAPQSPLLAMNISVSTDIAIWFPYMYLNESHQAVKKWSKLITDTMSDGALQYIWGLLLQSELLITFTYHFGGRKCEQRGQTYLPAS